MVVIHRSKKSLDIESSVSTITPIATEEPIVQSQPAFFLALEDFKRGILPNNEQLQNWLLSIRTSPALSTAELSPAGQRLILDFKCLVHILERLVRERNQDEILQRFAYHVSLSVKLTQRGMTKSSRITVMKGSRRRLYFGGAKDYQLAATRQEFRKKARESAYPLWQALVLIITSTDFRDALAQGQQLLSHLIPSEHRKKAFEEVYETPHAKLFVPKRKLNNFNKFECGGADNALVEDELHSLHTQISATHDKLERLQTVRHAAVEDEKENIGMNSTMFEAKYYPPVAEENYAFPKLAFDENEFMTDFKQLALRVHTGKFLPTLKELWNVISGLQARPPLIAEQSKNESAIVPTELRYDANFKAAQQDLLTILERFAPGVSLNVLLQNLQDIKSLANKDYQLKDFLWDWRAFFVRCVKEPAYMEHEEYKNRCHFLLTRTNDIFHERYREKLSEAYDELRGLLDGWGNDELGKEFSNCLQKIIKSDLLGLVPEPEEEEEGLAVESQSLMFASLQLINPDLVRDLRSVVLPNILRSLSVIPLPRIEALWDGTRLILENIVLPAESLVPMDLSIKSRSHLHLHPKQQYLQRATEFGRRAFIRNGTVFRASQLKANIPNIKFVIDKTTAFPRFKDAGLLDLSIGGKGLSIVVSLEASKPLRKSNRWITTKAETERQKRLQLHPHYVRVNIDRLKMRFHDSGHDNIYAIAAPLIQLATKRAIEMAIAERLVQSIDTTDRLLRRISKRQ